MWSPETTINGEKPKNLKSRDLKLKIMKKLFVLIIAVLCVSSLFSQTPRDYKHEMQKSYDKGDYVTASFSAIEYLRTSGKNKNAQEILSISFNMAVEQLNIEISDLKEMSKQFSGDKTVADRKSVISKYQALKNLDRKGREIIRLIPKQKVPLEFNKINVTTDLDLAQKMLDESINLAAEMHYLKGIEIMSRPDRQSQKTAAISFKKALEYLPNYKDANALYNDARKKGTTRVAIIPFDNLSRVDEFGGVGEIISDNLRSAIFNYKGASEFVEIYTRDQLNVIFQEHDLNMNSGIMNKETIAKFGVAAGIHIIITGKVLQLNVENGETINDGAVISSARVVVGTRSYTDSNGKTRSENVWGEVVAKNYYHHKSTSASINGSFDIIEIESGRILSSSNFSEQVNWQNNWATYSGDGRATRVPYGFDNGELPAPSRTELANKVINILGLKIANDVIGVIK